MRRPIVVFLLAVLASLGATAPLRAQDETTALMAKLAGADPDLRTYRADVAFAVGLHSFPFLHKTLHGNAYFKRPARMELVFTDLPPMARAWSNLYVGLGTPSDWEKKFTIASAADASSPAFDRRRVVHACLIYSRTVCISAASDDPTPGNRVSQYTR